MGAHLHQSHPFPDHHDDAEPTLAAYIVRDDAAYIGARMQIQLLHTETSVLFVRFCLDQTPRRPLSVTGYNGAQVVIHDTVDKYDVCTRQGRLGDVRIEGNRTGHVLSEAIISGVPLELDTGEYHACLEGFRVVTG